MATQQIEFVAAGGLTLTAALYAAGNDTAAYTASAVVEQVNRTSVYRATFSGVAAGHYQLIVKSGAMTVASWWGFAQDVAQTFTFGELAGSLGPTSILSAAFSAGAIDAAAIATDALGSLELSAGAASEIASAVRTELTTELGRVDAIKAKTDQLAFSVPNQVDANALTGGGGGGGNPLVGSGATTKTITVTNGAQPIDGVEVWVSTDSGGTNVVAGTLSTNAFGQVTFMLDNGNYYVWTQLAGYNFTNPTPITVP